VGIGKQVVAITKWYRVSQSSCKGLLEIAEELRRPIRNKRESPVPTKAYIFNHTITGYIQSDGTGPSKEILAR
jgi:hypothetical protein